MADLSFARQFLTTLSTRPSQLSPTHVEDPKTYPARGAYILPHTSLPPLKKRKRAVASTHPIHITLTSPRNPPLSIQTAQPPSVSILELKNIVSEEASISVSKIKILYGKKPVHDAKTLSEVLGDGGEGGEGGVELGLMVMGGSASVIPNSSATPNTNAPAVGAPGTDNAPLPNIDERPSTPSGQEPEGEIEMRDVEGTAAAGIPSTAIGIHGRDALMTPEFWDDLKGFLQQRLRDEQLGVEIAEKFRKNLVGGI